MKCGQRLGRQCCKAQISIAVPEDRANRGRSTPHGCCPHSHAQRDVDAPERPAGLCRANGTLAHLKGGHRNKQGAKQDGKRTSSSASMQSAL